MPLKYNKKESSQSSEPFVPECATPQTAHSDPNIGAFAVEARFRRFHSQPLWRVPSSFQLSHCWECVFFLYLSLFGIGRFVPISDIFIRIPNFIKIDNLKLHRTYERMLLKRSLKRLEKFCCAHKIQTQCFHFSHHQNRMCLEKIENWLGFFSYFHSVNSVALLWKEKIVRQSKSLFFSCTKNRLHHPVGRFEKFHFKISTTTTISLKINTTKQKISSRFSQPKHTVLYVIDCKRKTTRATKTVYSLIIRNSLFFSHQAFGFGVRTSFNIFSWIYFFRYV